MALLLNGLQEQNGNGLSINRELDSMNICVQLRAL